MGKYEKYVKPLRLFTENVRPYYRGKMADFSLIFDVKVQPETPIRVEIFHAYAAGTGEGNPGEGFSYWNGEPRDRDAGRQHSHNNFDELYLLFGSDPADNTRLGGELEFWLGDGTGAQKFIAREPIAEWVPRGLAHNPHLFTRINNSKLPIIGMAIALTHTYDTSNTKVKNYPLPPDYSRDRIGIEQPGKGLYTEYVNKLQLSQTILLPHLRGRVAVPTLMFDDFIFRAPVWVEIFHVYAGGTGIGVPTLERPLRRNVQQTKDHSQGMQRIHTFDQVFLFFGTDPHDILSLGGEVETWLGEEKYILTKASSVYIPRGVPFNPQYFKRVDRPYLMVVIALVDNARLNEGPPQITAAPRTFKF